MSCKCSSVESPLTAEVAERIVGVVPAIRAMAGRGGVPMLAKVCRNHIVEQFAEGKTADDVFGGESGCIGVAGGSVEEILADAEQKIDNYKALKGSAPKGVLIGGVGLVSIAETAADCQAVEEAYINMAQGKAAVETVAEMPSERRRKGRVEDKVFIITGAAQGFGEGIAKCLIEEGANIVVADLNECRGEETCAALNGSARQNRAMFVKVDIANEESLKELIVKTICRFGGVDVFVSNAGIVRSGGLDVMTAENFELVTKINYNAYFFCTKAASGVMKLQNRYNNQLWGDIIQINSKSGLRGSKANFAYAGSKFGGIGLTQSCALELAPYRIKVNAICPGNYYDGPLWSDPVNGLFIQYLNAGKIPGATTVEEVREYYMSQVPMRKGCSPEDVCKAVMYLIEQTCETGQALPITGGQVMLN